MEKLYLKIKMDQYSKIIPKWGKNRYNLWSCESLEYQDPEIEKMILSVSSSKKVSFKQIRQLNIITCMDCKHYTTGQCPISNEEIKQNAKKYKSLKPKCTVCNLPLSFHHFLLHKNLHEKLCIICSEAKINGSLKKRQKKQRKSKIWVIFRAICLCCPLVFFSIEIFLDGVFDWADYLFIGIFVSIFIGYISYYVIKRRKKKKIEEGN